MAWYPVKEAAGGEEAVSVFLFQRAGKTYAACWNNQGSGTLALPLKKENVRYVKTLRGEECPLAGDGDSLMLEIAEKRYLITELSLQELEAAFVNAKLIK